MPDPHERPRPSRLLPLVDHAHEDDADPPRAARPRSQGDPSRTRLDREQMRQIARLAFGEDPTIPPSSRTASADRNVCTLRPVVPSTARWTGRAPASASSGRRGHIFHRRAIARNRGNRGRTAASSAGSTKPPWWFATIRMGPRRVEPFEAAHLDGPEPADRRQPRDQLDDAVGEGAHPVMLARSATTMPSWSRGVTNGRPMREVERAAVDRARRRAPGSRLRAAAGVIGPAVFTTAWAVSTRRQPAYSIANEHISGLAAADATDPALMTAGFVALGVSTVVFAAELDRRLGGAGRSGYGAALMAASGLAMVSAGLFRRDRVSNYPMPGRPDEPQSWVNDVHDLASVAAGALALGLARRARRTVRGGPGMARPLVAGVVGRAHQRGCSRPGSPATSRDPATGSSNEPASRSRSDS